MPRPLPRPRNYLETCRRQTPSAVSTSSRTACTTPPTSPSHKRFVDNDTVTVSVRRDAPGIFAKVLGIDSVNVGAKAKALTTGLQAAR